ncbi:MAG: energy transducer TonB [Chitinophagaceae bacterium]
MILNKLNPKLKGIVAALAIITFVVACNNSDESANNSTSTESKDTSGTSANPALAKKRTGKVSLTMKDEDATVKIEKDKEGYYSRTEMAPAYPGGQGALDTYINNNIVYPQEAIDNNIEGTVYVRFGVDENGKVSNVSTVGNKLGYGLEEEAVKVVTDMPQWTAGTVKGKNVKTWRTLPITYKLES